VQRTGGHLGPEAQVGELAGYLGSRPVRVGNAAAQQVQLDVFGPIAELLALLAERGAALSSEHWRMLQTIVQTVAERWHEPDHGIWEIRLSRQHYVHSKIMCWQTVDRALRVARYLGQKRPAWEQLRQTISADVLTNGWLPECNAFCATYGSQDADAGTLAVGLSGLLSPDDPRFVGTVEYVEKHLCTDGCVYRYRYDDGLPGIEGSFLLCTAWLVEACVLCGRTERAWELFESLCAKAGPTGLIAEEWDPQDERSLGNFPQAYSHLGLINAALRLAEAGR
jgi:GH15 family glucan-1,4-alpha-glucosidase